MEMDFAEAAKIVYNKVYEMEPEYASKIIGLLLLQDQGYDEMIRLASAPESAIVSLVKGAKAEIHRFSLKSPANDQPRYSPFPPARPFSSPSAIGGPSPYWGSQLDDLNLNTQKQEFCPGAYANNSIGVIGEGLNDKSLFLEDQLGTLNLGPDFSNNCYFSEQALLESLNYRTNRRTPTLTDYASKACHYFNKGNCWHGINCRFVHGQGMQDDYSHLMNSSIHDVGYDEQSLGKLQSELIELLMSRRGMPVSISSLPTLYYQKYGKNLEVDGYLTEGQRQGKAGFNLTKVLALLSDDIRIIERPHGQHGIMLAEDAPRLLDFKYEKNDYGAVVSGSRQIYLTFPAESTFTEKDVADYFSTYGLVDDVRIPSQQKRMFGFVTFSSAETVKRILAKGNPHHVCGARVLVKPYREKSRLDRKYSEKMDSSMYYPPRFFELENTRLHSGPRLYDNARLLRKKLMEDHDRAIEFERRRYPDFHLASKSLSQQAYVNCPVADDAKLTDQSLMSSDHLGYFFNTLDNGSSNQGKVTLENGFDEQESSQTLNLPESPFASPITSGISTVM